MSVEICDRSGDRRAVEATTRALELLERGVEAARARHQQAIGRAYVNPPRGRRKALEIITRYSGEYVRGVAERSNKLE
ncbi:hypothetical protein ACIRU3_20960 [Streptomyces sp. NPDC101151]|uniref:hypothetical protein n=1 Tax=Streptomyces sp. NPDC101151 TaxID=3366115 RepID=UPI00382751FB